MTTEIRQKLKKDYRLYCALLPNLTTLFLFSWASTTSDLYMILFKIGPFRRPSNNQAMSLSNVCFELTFDIHQTASEKAGSVMLNLSTFMPHYNTSKFLKALPILNMPYFQKYQHFKEKNVTMRSLWNNRQIKRKNRFLAIKRLININISKDRTLFRHLFILTSLFSDLLWCSR